MYRIVVQRATKKYFSPSTKQLAAWAKETLKRYRKNAELTIRIVTEKEMIALNSTYRHKNKPTNVLSFPYKIPEALRDEIFLLGDIVICAKVISEEAQEQHKDLMAHWAHMIIHGCLHLLGYDHVNEEDAELMEGIEILLLKKIGFPNPYKQEK